MENQQSQNQNEIKNPGRESVSGDQKSFSQDQGRSSESAKPGTQSSQTDKKQEPQRSGDAGQKQ